jgi:hypothetical protein
MAAPGASRKRRIADDADDHLARRPRIRRAGPASRGHHGAAQVGRTYRERNRSLGPLTTRSTWTVREIQPGRRRVDTGTGFAPLRDLTNIFGCILLGQVVLSAGQPLVVNSTTKLAAQYFPAPERTAAISVASAAQFCGILAAALTAVPLVQAGGLGLLLALQAAGTAAGFLLLAGNLGGMVFVLVIQALIGNPYLALAAMSVIALPGLALATRLLARVTAPAPDPYHQHSLAQGDSRPGEAISG